MPNSGSYLGTETLIMAARYTCWASRNSVACVTTSSNTGKKNAVWWKDATHRRLLAPCGRHRPGRRGQLLEIKPTSQARPSMPQVDPNVWSGRASQEGSANWRWRSCINVSGLWLKHVLRAIMDISAPESSLPDRPRWAIWVTCATTSGAAPPHHGDPGR